MTHRKSRGRVLATAVTVLVVAWPGLSSRAATPPDGLAAHTSPAQVAAVETVILAVDGMT